VLRLSHHRHIFSTAAQNAIAYKFPRLKLIVRSFFP
jgi:hypothetical protein